MCSVDDLAHALWSLVGVTLVVVGAVTYGLSDGSRAYEARHGTREYDNYVPAWLILTGAVMLLETLVAMLHCAVDMFHPSEHKALAARRHATVQVGLGCVMLGSLLWGTVLVAAGIADGCVDSSVGCTTYWLAFQAALVFMLVQWFGCLCVGACATYLYFTTRRAPVVKGAVAGAPSSYSLDDAAHHL